MNAFWTLLGFPIYALAKAVSTLSPLERSHSIKSRLEGPWPKGPFLWLHGASHGECRMLLDLARALQQDLPAGTRILITTQKPEVLQFLKKSAQDVETAMAPADTPISLKKFLMQVQPTALILGENELWPGFLAAMRKSGKRIALVSGRYRKSCPGADLAAIGFAAMQTPEDRERFLKKSTGGKKFTGENEPCSASTIVGGDWKMLSWARSHIDNNPGRNGNCPVDTSFVSIHREEWNALGPIVQKAVSNREVLVFLPRRLGEIAFFTNALAALGIPIVDWPTVQKGSVSMVRQFGLTGQVLAISRSAVVGGSFCAKLGVHDFWEPIRMGVATFIGPFSSGKSEMAGRLMEQHVLGQISSADDYARRTLPDAPLVKAFLAEESQRILGSYRQLLEYLKQ